MEKIEGQLSEVLEQMDKEDDESPEPGFPMTEIIEELDEDGNIISSKVTQPEQQTAQIIETLRKAGLKEMDSKSGIEERPGILRPKSKEGDPLPPRSNHRIRQKLQLDHRSGPRKESVSQKKFRKERFRLVLITPMPANRLESTLPCSMAHLLTASVLLNWTMTTRLLELKLSFPRTSHQKMHACEEKCFSTI